MKHLKIVIFVSMFYLLLGCNPSKEEISHIRITYPTNENSFEIGDTISILIFVDTKINFLPNYGLEIYKYENGTWIEVDNNAPFIPEPITLDPQQFGRKVIMDGELIQPLIIDEGKDVKIKVCVEGEIDNTTDLDSETVVECEETVLHSKIAN